MKIGIVVTIYNRPEYFSRMLDSLKKAELLDSELFMVNDNSTDPTVNRLFHEFSLPNIKIKKVVNDKNRNMFYGLRLGWGYFHSGNFDILANLDSDAIVKPYFLPILLQLNELFPDNIISGFNTSNHPIYETFSKYHTKSSIGGINFLFSKHLYPPIADFLKDLEWDWNVCHFMQKQKKDFIVSNPSVVQHIGVSSTLKSHIRIDVADDF